MEIPFTQKSNTSYPTVGTVYIYIYMRMIRVSYRTVDIGNKKDSEFGVRGAGDVGGKATELFDMAGAAAGV